MKRLCQVFGAIILLLVLCAQVHAQSVFEINAQGIGTMTTKLTHFQAVTTVDPDSAIIYSTELKHASYFRAINTGGTMSFGVAIAPNIETYTSFSLAPTPGAQTFNVRWNERAGLAGTSILSGDVEGINGQSSYESAAFGGSFYGSAIDSFDSRSFTSMNQPSFAYEIAIKNGVGTMGVGFGHVLVQNGDTVAQTFQQSEMSGAFSFSGSVSWKPAGW